MPEQSVAKTSLVIPVFNESGNLRALHEEIGQIVPRLPGPVEIIYVDDGSTDDSHKVLQSIFEADPIVQIIRLRRNSGKAAALDAGFTRARGEVVVTLDADLQDIPAEIPRLIERLDEGWDLVSGWKTDRRDPFFKRIRSRVFNWVVGLVAGPRLHDHNCGLKAYRAVVIRQLNLYGDLIHDQLRMN